MNLLDGSRSSRRRYDFPLEFLFLNRFQQTRWGQLARIKADFKCFVVKINRNLLDTWKPCQGFFDLVRSGNSGEVEAFNHALDVQVDRLHGLGGNRSFGRRFFFFFFAPTACQQEGRATYCETESCALEHDYSNST